LLLEVADFAKRVDLHVLPCNFSHTPRGRLWLTSRVNRWRITSKGVARVLDPVPQAYDERERNAVETISINAFLVIALPIERFTQQRRTVTGDVGRDRFEA
jgi:hypothetical protein